jgi:hypothetical protein
MPNKARFWREHRRIKVKGHRRRHPHTGKLSIRVRKHTRVIIR